MTKGKLDSVEVIKRRIPIDRDGFFAFGISANMILFGDVTMKTASQWLFKGICGMNFIWRRRFKNPMAIWAFEGKFRCSHNTPSSYYYATSKLKIDMIKSLEKIFDLKV